MAEPHPYVAKPVLIHQADAPPHTAGEIAVQTLEVGGATLIIVTARHKDGIVAMSTQMVSTDVAMAKTRAQQAEEDAQRERDESAAKAETEAKERADAERQSSDRLALDEQTQRMANEQTARNAAQKPGAPAKPAA